MLPCDKVRSGTKPSRCPDDKIMATRKFWRTGSSGSCTSLDHGTVLKGVATTTWNFPVLGNSSLVLTKAWVTHPSMADKRVGVVMFKRLVTHTCTGARPSFCKKGDTVADVYKLSYCIKCINQTTLQPQNVFKHTHSEFTTTLERKQFLEECLPNAVNASTGKIKTGFQCGDDDQLKAMASLAIF